MANHMIETEDDNVNITVNNQDQLWSISTLNFDIENKAKMNSLKSTTQTNQELENLALNKDLNNSSSGSGAKVQNNHQSASDTVFTFFQRLGHFLRINLLLNKYTVILSVFGYFSDLLLFISLNLYLFSNKKFLYDFKCVQKPSPLPPPLSSSSSSMSMSNNTWINSSTSQNNISLIRRRRINILQDNILIDNLTNSLNSINDDKDNLESTRTIKQSYLTLQIIVVFIFFICFIISYLIKLQFKYHRWAINLYDYDIEAINQQDRDGLASLASTTTASHFSSSKNKKLFSLFKRLLIRLFTKIASILLNFLFGYQFCQNCFIEEPNQLVKDAYSIFIHFFILTCVLVRCVVNLFIKKNSMNYVNNLKKLQEKALYDPKSNLNKNYYFNYYTYLIKYSQHNCNQLKQHQNNQNTFRVFQLEDLSLFAGFIFALFHLFLFSKSIELIFVLLPLLLTLILFRVKSILNASLNLLVIFVSFLLISNLNSFNSIREISSYLAKLTNTSDINFDKYSNILNNNCTLNSDLESLRNKSSIINIFSYNMLTLLSFLLTFYFKSLLSIYYCTLNSLERWNLSFLCNLSFWRKCTIYISYFIYILFILTCTITLCIRFKSWSFLVVPIYFLFAITWCSFQLLNIINLRHLMNKINDCYMLLNESNSFSNVNSFENASNISKKSKSSHLIPSQQQQSNRDSTLTQSSSSNNNNNNNNNNSNRISKLKFSKYLSRFLNYHKLNKSYDSNTNINNNFNIPIHRILAYKGVRHLGSISYRISLYCFVQTLLLAPFAYNTNSPLTIGLYLTTLSINFIWLSLLYQFPKSATGTCIAYALVAPPLILNIYNAGTLGTTLSSNPTISNVSKKSKTNSSSASSAYYSSSSSNCGTTMGNSLMFLPFNYQQALMQRCNYILSKFQAFLQFHLIENYGCDFASTGLNKQTLELKIKSYFQKRSNDGSFYNSYILYYCGPTSALTDNLSFIDGNELSIEKIVQIWREIHCNSDQIDEIKIDRGDDPNAEQIMGKSFMSSKNSRLIIVLDAEHTTKSLEYIKTKLNEKNIYVALQTVKYNHNTNNLAMLKCSKNSETKSILGEKKSKQKIMAPGSPQAINESFFDSYLNIGKFTLDWIKSNCNSFSLTNQDIDNLNRIEDYFLKNDLEFDEDKENLHGKESEDDEDDDSGGDDDDDDENDDDDSIDYETNKTNDKMKSKKQTESSSLFYEAKCAFSKYWTNYTFDSSDSTLINDLNQFWNIYYPYVICRPMLKLINCRLFYLKLDFIKRLFLLLKRVKNKLIPVHEYDTGHGFKLFTS